MSRLLVLSAEDVRKVLTIKDALDAVEDAYRQKATGEASLLWELRTMVL